MCSGALTLPPCLPVGERPPPLVLSLTLNWRRRLAISYSLCSSMPRRRHHLREFLLRSDFTWVEVDMRCQGLASSERGGGTDLPPRTPSMGPNTSHWEDARQVGALSALHDTCFLPSSRSQPTAPFLQEALPDHTGSDTPSRLSQPPGLPIAAYSGWSLSRDSSHSLHWTGSPRRTGPGGFAHHWVPSTAQLRASPVGAQGTCLR